jgi:uncharacterized protein (TIGR03435 family)
MTLLAQAISTALLDFIWQGALIGAALWLVLAMLRHQSAGLRYVISCVALLLLATLPLATIATVWSMARETAVAAGSSFATSGTAETGLATAAAVASPARVPQTLLQIWMVPEAPRVIWFDAVHPWILPIWAIGVLLLSVRLTAACWYASRLSRSAGDSDPAVAPMVADLARRIGVSRAVRLRTMATATTPGVVGWLRPVLLLPPAAAMGLTPTQLEAVLAHELAHIKRHDYLVNMVQVVIETLFFYHPVVWWTSHQIRLEREVCCDDVAVRACGNAADYARGLTALARRQLTPLAQAATGGPLMYRVRRLLGMAPRELAAGDVAGIVAMVVAVGGIVLHMDRLQAQETLTGGDRPRFEVTSVKVNASGDGIVIIQSAGSRFTARGFSAAELVRLAYRVQEFQTAGGPDWMNSVRFDIVAKYPEGASGVKDAERMMLRTLLEDRFGLMVHKETRERPVYAIVVAKSGTLGSELRRSTADCTSPKADCGGWVGPGFIRQRGKTMAQIAEEFSKLTTTGSSLNRLVVDRSGLEGRFDMDLRFTPELIPPMPGGRPAWLPEIDPNGPPIFTAVQEQLGLKLDAQHGPVEVLVIDRLERPTEN